MYRPQDFGQKLKPYPTASYATQANSSSSTDVEQGPSGGIDGQAGRYGPHDADEQSLPEGFAGLP